MSEREDSVLTNLKELMDLEDERITKEDLAARKRAEEQARQKAEAEARKKADEEARVKAEEQAKLDAERRIRDEEDRKVREKEEGELRLRLEMEQKARAEEQARMLAHETKLREIEATRRKGVHPGVFVGMAVLVLGGAAYGYFGVYEPARQEAAKKAAEAMRQAEIQAAEKRRIEEELMAMQEAEKKLKEALAEAKSSQNQAAVDQAEKQIQELRERRTRIVKRPSKPSSKPSPKRDGLPSASDDNDPLRGLEDL